VRGGTADGAGSDLAHAGTLREGREPPPPPEGGRGGRVGGERVPLVVGMRGQRGACHDKRMPGTSQN
jgi:hypothetical protein